MENGELTRWFAFSIFAFYGCFFVRKGAPSRRTLQYNIYHQMKFAGTVCEPRIFHERYARVTRLPFSFSKRSPVSGLRRAKKQRETGVKRVETAGVYPFAPTAWVRRPQRAAKFVMFLCFRLCLFRNSVILIAFVKYRKGSIVI